MDSTLHAHAKKIIDEVVDLPGPERAAAIQSLCASDPALKARVLELLAAMEENDRFLAGPTVHGESVPAAEVEQPGSRIGRYKILERIGEGGFGAVFMAEQSEPIRRRVALKIIKLGMDTRAVVARFEQERQALALMDHPNIAKVLDAGATDAGRPYFVMELVKGEPITTFADAHRLSIRDRLDLFVQVCRAVQHAHTKGIIHRDIKPTNVLVSISDGRSVCKVIDFGIAKATQRPLTDKTVFTEFRQLVGTPEYMSPEQAGGSLDVDTRTDVYSLGVLLYELLSGTTPLDPRELRSAAFGEMQRMIREIDPPRPSTRLSQTSDKLPSIAAVRDVEPRRLGAIIRGELDWIVMRALEKDRARRYESPGNLAADVERYLDGKPVEAAPASIGYRLVKVVRRNRLAFAAGAAMALLLVGGIVGTSIGLVRASLSAREARNNALAAIENSQRADREARQAIANAELATQNAMRADAAAAEATRNAKRADTSADEARQNAKEAESVDDLMHTMIGAANRGRQEGRADVTVREVMDKAAKELTAGRWSSEPRIEARLAKSIGEVYRELALFEPAEAMLALHVKRQRELFGATSQPYGEALGDFGGLIKSRGDFAQAQRVFDEALTVLTALGEPAAEDALAVKVNIAALAATKGDWESSEKGLREVVEAFEKRGAAERNPPPGPYLIALRNLAATLYQRRDLDGAEKQFKKSIALRRAVPGVIGPDLQLDLHNLGALQFSRGDTDTAIKTMREEVAVARKLYGDEHIEVAGALTSLAVVLSRLEKFDDEVAAEREALAIQLKLLGPDHSTVAETRHMLGGALMSLGKYDQAERELRSARDVMLAKLGATHNDTIYAGYQLALALEHRATQPALAEAETVLRESLEGAKAGLKEGSKYEWTRYAVESLLGAILLDQSALPGAADPAAKLREAEPLITGAPDRLAAVIKKPGPRTRKLVFGAAFERAVRLATILNDREPTAEHAAALAQWQRRLDEFKAADK